LILAAVEADCGESIDRFLCTSPELMKSQAALRCRSVRAILAFISRIFVGRRKAMNRLFNFFLRGGATPRIIDRRTHAVLDYLTTSYFMILAAYFWDSNKRAAATALINGGAVLGASMFTDYPGALVRKIPFETHGKIDMMQATMAAVLPSMLGFGGEAAAMPFRMQALNEVAVVMATDWHDQEAIREESLREAS
jgi:hypothetical protein